MRTTIRLDDELLSQVKQLAARTGRTLTAVIESALRRELTSVSNRREARRSIDLPTFDGSGLQSGVDLDSSAALLDLMERPD